MIGPAPRERPQTGTVMIRDRRGWMGGEGGGALQFDPQIGHEAGRRAGIHAREHTQAPMKKGPSRGPSDGPCWTWIKRAGFSPWPVGDRTDQIGS